MGSFTLTIMSAFAHTWTFESTISAPAARYSASGKAESSPAFVSSNTLCPLPPGPLRPRGYAYAAFVVFQFFRNTDDHNDCS